MTIQGVYTQQLTLTFSTSSFSSGGPSPAPAVTADAGAGKTEAITARIHGKFGRPTDRATLSQEALSREADATKQATGPAATTAAPAPTPPAGEGARGDALFDALDADDDGTITEEEFVNGARELLGRAHRHHRGHRHDHDAADGVRHGHSQEGSRLERRLGRLFDLVDANGDGSIAKDELSSALQKTGHRRSPADAVVAPGTPVTAQATQASETENLQAGTASKTQARPSIVAEPSESDRSNEVSENDAATPPTASGNLVTVTQITVTVAIRQYTTLSFNDTSDQAETFHRAA